MDTKKPEMTEAQLKDIERRLVEMTTRDRYVIGHLIQPLIDEIRTQRQTFLTATRQFGVAVAEKARDIRTVMKQRDDALGHAVWKDHLQWCAEEQRDRVLLALMAVSEHKPGDEQHRNDCLLCQGLHHDLEQIKEKHAPWTDPDFSP